MQNGLCATCVCVRVHMATTPSSHAAQAVTLSVGQAKSSQSGLALRTGHAYALGIRTYVLCPAPHILSRKWGTRWCVCVLCEQACRCACVHTALVC